MLRDKIIAEAIAQRELIREGRHVPANLKVYARTAGLITSAVTSIAMIAVLFLGERFGIFHMGALLFLSVMALLGLLQGLTGRHILTRR